MTRSPFASSRLRVVVLLASSVRDCGWDTRGRGGEGVVGERRERKRTERGATEREGRDEHEGKRDVRLLNSKRFFVILWRFRQLDICRIRVSQLYIR